MKNIDKLIINNPSQEPAQYWHYRLETRLNQIRVLY